MEPDYPQLTMEDILGDAAHTDPMPLRPEAPELEGPFYEFWCPECERHVERLVGTGYCQQCINDAYRDDPLYG